MPEQYRCVRWLLGDQLNEHHSWFEQVNDDVLYVIAELHQETTYTRHHIQKLCAFFAAMDSFATRLEELGHRVLHLDLDATAEYENLPALMLAISARYRASELHYQRPDEYRLLMELRNFKSDARIEVCECDSEHFLLSFTELDEYFTKGKHVRMESFYRKMRKRFGILMEGEEPAGGRWNYDVDNRNKFKPADLADIPSPLLFSTPVSGILARLERHSIPWIGKTRDPLPWPVTRKQGLKLLDFFCQHCLPNFGRFQDALTGRSEHSWSLYHSRLSFALNTKLLSPLEVIAAAISAYDATKQVDLAQVEGFVRQILGWREYIRGCYWVNMPDYTTLNHYGADRNLPEFFWTGDTRMRCMQKAIGQSLDHAYAHHIQRLMITGNFCVLTGIDPDQVEQWYLGIYLDAMEWVESPNTRGMALHADGGLVGTKPYAAGGNYINKMSDYCGDCHYNVKEKTGSRACPFNSLYWHFMDRHRDELENNQRLRMLYGTWDRMGANTQKGILAHAELHLSRLDKL